MTGSTHPDDTPSAVASLPREPAAPAGLEERLVRRLAARGLVRRRSTVRWLLPLAASLAGLALGWWGRAATAVPTPAAADRGSLFLLLLSNDPPAGPPVAERVELYRAWARRLAAEGRLATAEKLTDARVVVEGGRAEAAPSGSDPAAPTGFFLVRASDLAEAVALARSSPHARLGGRVTVRPVDPV